VRTVIIQSSIAVGISLPKELMSKIDDERGDISPSRYLLRIVEKAYRNQKNSHRSYVNTKNSKNSLDGSAGTGFPPGKEDRSAIVPGEVYLIFERRGRAMIYPHNNQGLI
jgi:hypothetical protein